VDGRVGIVENSCGSGVGLKWGNAGGQMIRMGTECGCDWEGKTAS